MIRSPTSTVELINPIWFGVGVGGSPVPLLWSELRNLTRWVGGSPVGVVCQPIEDWGIKELRNWGIGELRNAPWGSFSVVSLEAGSAKVEPPNDQVPRPPSQTGLTDEWWQNIASKHPQQKKYRSDFYICPAVLKTTLNQPRDWIYG